MFILHAHKTKLTLRQRELVTSGSVNVYPVRFEFSPDWDGLQKTAVFRAGNGSVSALLNDSGEVNVPWEVIRKPGIALQVGIYGTRGEDEVLPTVWANLGVILEGAEPGEIARPPTPDLWQQELAGKADGMKYDGLNLHLKSGEKTLSTVRIVSGGGGEGGPVYNFGHGLKQEGLNVSVNTVIDFTGDNTLPMTAAGVQTAVGNIEALLATI